MATKNELIDGEEIEQHTRKFQRELNSGTVSLVLLSILEHAKKPLYGYEITKQLQQKNDGKQGAIYPVLRNLHARNLINCEVKISVTGPPRKYFTISMLGKKVLKQWLISWQTTQSHVNKIISGSFDNE
jgi:PadR family transcriptional regulator PadR